MLANVPLERIEHNPWQTRPLDAEHVQVLADDIRANGLLQPPVARMMLHGHLVDPELYGGVLPALRDEPEATVELALGHHRLAAYRLLTASAQDAERWTAMPVDVRPLDSYQMALAAWSENEKRRDTNPLERAQAIQRMSQDFGWTQAAIAEKLGISRPVVSNALRLLTLPDDVKKRIAAGEMSERQAMALLPLFELPATAIKMQNESYAYPKPARIIELASKSSSDTIREEVERIRQNATMRLDVPWAEYTFDERGLKAPVCGACGERIQINKSLRCPYQTCYDRKQQLWAARRLAEASAALGIAAAPEEMAYGEYAKLNSVPHPEQVISKRCENLRLCWRGDDANSVTRVRAEGYPDVEVICLHGQGGRCKCGPAAKAAATRADPDVQELKATQKRIQAEIVEPAWRAVLAGLQAGHTGVWFDLATAAVYGLRVDEQAGLEAIQVMLAKGLVKRQMYVRDENDFGAMKQGYEARLKNLGLPLPWDVPPEEDLRRRYDRIAGWVAQEVWWKFDYEVNLEAIAGNLVNLTDLLAEAQALGESAGDLPRQIETLAQQLRELEPVAQEINELRKSKGIWWKNELPRTICCRLEVEPVGSLAFDRALAAAEPIHLRYALVFADTLERLQALYDRLAQLGAVVEAEPITAL